MAHMTPVGAFDTLKVACQLPFTGEVGFAHGITPIFVTYALLLQP